MYNTECCDYDLKPSRYIRSTQKYDIKHSHIRQQTYPARLEKVCAGRGPWMLEVPV